VFHNFLELIVLETLLGGFATVEKKFDLKCKSELIRITHC